MRLLRRGLILLPVLALACRDAQAPAGPREDPGLGTPLGYTGQVFDLTWVPGSSVLVFRAPATATDGCGLKALDVESREVWMLDADCTRVPFFTGNVLRGIVASPDGRTIAYQLGVALPEPFGAAVRVVAPWGGPPTEVARASRLWAALALAPDASRLAFAYSLADSLVIRDLAGGNDARLTGGRPLAFSPDGAELLYQAGAPLVRRLVLASGSTIPVPLGLGVTDLAGPMTWDSGGIWMFVDGLDEGWQVRNLTTGRLTVLESFVPQWRLREATWLRDGRRIGYWLEHCASGSAGGVCEVDEALLVVADRHSGTHTTVAAANAIGGPIAFAPDGRSVAYRLGDQLYLSPVP